MHIVTINPDSGKVETAQVFETHYGVKGFDSFIENDAVEGSIVVAACKDECNSVLSEKSKNWFTAMGSKEIWDLRYK